MHFTRHGTSVWLGLHGVASYIGGTLQYRLLEPESTFVSARETLPRDGPEPLTIPHPGPNGDEQFPVADEHLSLG